MTKETPSLTVELADSPSVKTIGVLHVINGEHYAGAERVQDLLAEELPRCGFHAGFACLKPGEFPVRRHASQAPLYAVPMRHRGDFRAARRVAEIVRREGYRLIHAHTVRGAMIGRLAARRAEVPWIYHVHSPAARNSASSWRNRVNNLVERISLRGASRLIAVSGSLREQMICEGFDPQRITVVHNGVPPLYEIPPRSKPRGVWTLGAVALFRPRKGIEVLLEALGLLRYRGYGFHLRAVGQFETPAYERKIRTQAEHLGLADCITWTGFTGDVLSELLEMDLFVLPSLYGEGLPMVVLEAMAAGVPVVAADVEGVPEAIRNRQDGLLVRPGDAYDLAQAVAAVIDGQVDWLQLRENALHRQKIHFSDRSMSEGVAAVYRQVLKI
ncbi:MAG: glycosyltransferase [Pirellulales bacterium]|nr:glycosyltransferase [Pirellulales bacterium]